VLNGADVREAFIHAKDAIYYCEAQNSQLDDNGNGIGNEKPDGRVSKHYTIGVGIILAGDDPLIGSVVSGQTLYGTPSATLWAEDITTTGTIERVFAVVAPPRYLKEIPGLPGEDPVTVDLVDNGSGRYEGTYSGFSTYGRYEIAVYAIDTEGNVSVPKGTYVFQGVGPDLFEDDDTLDDAKVIILDYERAQRHTFHDQGDEDWVKFYGIAGENYAIKTDNLDSNCDTVITLYDADGKVVEVPKDDRWYGEYEELTWRCDAEGVYHIKVTPVMQKECTTSRSPSLSLRILVRIQDTT
jgi:hypothetical protein